MVHERVVVTTKGAVIRIRDFVLEDLPQVVEIDNASLLGGSAEIYASLAGIQSPGFQSSGAQFGAEMPKADVFLVAVDASGSAVERRATTDTAVKAATDTAAEKKVTAEAEKKSVDKTAATAAVDAVKNTNARKEASARGKVLGFIVSVPISQEVSRIFALAVHPKYRGRGIGKALLKAALNELRRLRRYYVRLEVRESNFIAQNLYKSMNFSEIGYIPFYYYDGEGAIIMHKVL